MTCPYCAGPHALSQCRLWKLKGQNEQRSTIGAALVGQLVVAMGIAKFAKSWLVLNLPDAAKWNPRQGPQL